MRSCQILLSLFTASLLASSARAQNGSAISCTLHPDSTAESILPATAPAPLPQESSPDFRSIDSSDDRLIAQARVYGRMRPHPARGPRGRVYGSGFAPAPSFSAKGALIGFGMGAALGAAGRSDGTVRGHIGLGLVVGGLGAVIGGAVGAMPSPFQAGDSRHRRPHRGPGRHEDGLPPEDGNQEASGDRDPHARSADASLEASRGNGPSTVSAKSTGP